MFFLIKVRFELVIHRKILQTISFCRTNDTLIRLF